MFIVTAMLGGCHSTPPGVAECPAEGGSESGCGEEPPPEQTPECADPGFDTTHPPATEYQCVGQAGGNIVYRQVEVVIAGNVVGGGPDSTPGAPEDPDEPNWTQIPSMDHSASACCYGFDPTMDAELIMRGEAGCQKDCARAACNDVLERIRDKLELDDASDGACDAAPNGFGGRDGCRANVRKSLEGWVAQLEARYDECVDATFFGRDPSLHYWDIDVAVADQKKFVFTTDPDCSHSELGCLFGAELRPFCDIQSFNTLMSCEMAGNDRDPNADGGVDPDTTAGGGGVVDPFGNIGSLVSCSTQTTCAVHEALRYNVEYNFHVFYDEGVVLTLGTYATGVTGFAVSGLNAGEDSKELFDALSFINGDVITHVNGVALDSWDDVIATLEDLDALGSWSITVKRKVSGVWRTRNYTITIVTPITGAPPSEASSPASGEAPGASDGATSCACHATDGPPTPARLAALLLGGLLFRRRHRN